MASALGRPRKSPRLSGIEGKGHGVAHCPGMSQEELPVVRSVLGAVITHCPHWANSPTADAVAVGRTLDCRGLEEWVVLVASHVKAWVPGRTFWCLDDMLGKDGSSPMYIRIIVLDDVLPLSLWCEEPVVCPAGDPSGGLRHVDLL